MKGKNSQFFAVKTKLFLFFPFSEAGHVLKMLFFEKFEPQRSYKQGSYRKKACKPYAYKKTMCMLPCLLLVYQISQPTSSIPYLHSCIRHICLESLVQADKARIAICDPFFNLPQRFDFIVIVRALKSRTKP